MGITLRVPWRPVPVALASCVLTAGTIVPYVTMESDPYVAMGSPLYALVVQVSAVILFLVLGITIIIRGALHSVGQSYGWRVRITAPSVAAYLVGFMFAHGAIWIVWGAFWSAEGVSRQLVLIATLERDLRFVLVACLMWQMVLAFTHLTRSRAAPGVCPAGVGAHGHRAHQHGDL